jgi:hypothetical protein
MGVKAIGNRGAYDRSGALGIGGRAQSVLVNWSGYVADAAGGVIYVSAGDVTSHKDAVYQGYFFQAVGNSVKVAYTLQNPGTACDPRPSVQSSVAWVNEQTIAPGNIVPAQLAVAGPVGFAALRLTFTLAGEFYIVAR